MRDAGNVRARHLGALLGLGLILASSSAGQAAPAGAVAATPPFKYLFRVTALTMTSTLPYQQSKATTRYRLERPSESRWLTYLGRKPLPGARPRQYAAPVLPVVATATYSSSDPTCTQTIEFRPSKRRPLQAGLFLGQYGAQVRVRVTMDNVPLAAPAPGKDSGDPNQQGRCGKPVFDWYDNAAEVHPASVLAKPSFTMTFQRKVRFTDPGIESIDWTVKMVVQRVRYRTINCATEPGC
jgi:hypothetical protein